MRTTITLDRIDPTSRLPQAGDVLKSTRCAYRLLEIRPVDPRAWHDRWRCDVDRLGMLPVREEWLQPGAATFETVAYRRGEGPGDVAHRVGLRSDLLGVDEQLNLVDVDVPAAELDADQRSTPDARYLEPRPESIARTIGKPAIAAIRATTGIGTSTTGDRT